MIEYRDFKISEMPDSAYYIPNFITANEEKSILQKVYSSPKPKWKTLSNRRLQNWGGLPHPKGMIQEQLPQWLNEYLQKVACLKVFGDKIPNHVLVNEYLSGQGIMPHQDGPLFYPTIATINLGSHTLLDYYEKSIDGDQEDKEILKTGDRYIGSLLLERCSLLIVQDDLYHKYLHGICERTCDALSENVKNLKLCQRNSGTTLNRESRISLTIRHVPNTVKVKGKFLFKIK